jgi:N-acetylmuramoyl-L-alanine amidase
VPYKINLKLLILTLTSFSLFLCSFIGYSYAKTSHLSTFKISSVEDIDGVLSVVVDKVDTAKEYIIYAYDKNDNLIYSNSSDTNWIPLNINNINYQDNIKITATVMDNLGTAKDASNSLDYTWLDPSFNNLDNHIITADKIFSFVILGKLNDNYHINILYQNNVIYSMPVTMSYNYLAYNTIKNYQGRLTANLVNSKDRIVSTFNFYNSPTIVTDINITSPKAVDNLVWEDILLTVAGGDNATKKYVDIMQNNKIIKTINFDNADYLNLDANLFKPNTNYTLKVTAQYEDYQEIAKSAAIDIFIGSEAQVLPVYINHYEANLKVGSQLTLKTKTENATIKYTLDGSDPLTNGITYTEPLIINNNATLKTIAIKNHLDNSDLETYNLVINNKPIVIYLSPSNQYKNIGVASAGYTNEMEWMNKVCDIVESKLKAAGIEVYRNNPYADGGMKVWLAESRKVKSDLHLAIHSNASHDHDAQGTVVYVDNSSSLGYSFANILYDDIYSIYPYKSAATNFGVKYALGGLGEVNPENISRGVLIETAFHDNYDDAKWIVDNCSQIGENIASSIIDFYQIGG